MEDVAAWSASAREGLGWEIGVLGRHFQEAVPSRRVGEASEWWLRGGLGVAALAGKGRGVVALEALAAGEVVAEELPLGSALSGARGFCAQCGLAVPQTLSAQPASCAECGEAWCGAACRAKALAYHWLECGQPEDLVGAPGDIFRMCLRVFFGTPAGLRSVWDKSRAAVIEEPLDVALDSMETRLHLAASLPNHKKETRAMADWPQLKRRVNILAKRIHKHLKETTPSQKQPSKAQVEKQLLHIVMVAYTNTFNIYRNEDEGELGSTPASVIGSGLYPGVSLLNHSCLPNTSRLFEGTRMVMRVIRPVKLGEELTTTYGTDVKVELTAERREALSSWCFECACEDACGSAEWRAKEAAYWGFACRFCVGGACLPTEIPPAPPKPWTLEQIYEKALSSGLRLVPGAFKGSLPILCHSCLSPDRLTGNELFKVVSALKVIRQEEPFREDLAQLVRALHPRNHQRLIVEWTVELARCGRGPLDERALGAMWAVTASLHGLLGGAHDLDSADDALEALRLLLARPLNRPSRRHALHLKHIALTSLANHYGTDSLQALRVHQLRIPPLSLAHSSD